MYIHVKEPDHLDPGLSRVIAAVYLMKNLKSCEDYATQGQGDLPFCNTLHKLWWPKMLYLK